MKQTNNTFTGGDPTWANACVGENGLPNYWEYAKGFSQAAIILIEQVLQSSGLDLSVDELIYPVCFNMRHSVELRLKGTIAELNKLEKFRSRTIDFDLAGSHDIGNIWQFITIKTREIDDRYEPLVEKLNAIISDIAAIDATGQTFRYPLDTESRKHLVNISIINFFTLRDAFLELESSLDELHRLNKYLEKEYSWGTFTKKLSRRNIFALSSLLPKRSSWTEESFSKIKESIKEEFKIGSRDLSDGINLVQRNFELAPSIGITIPLHGVSLEDIDKFFHHWMKLHTLLSDSDSIDFSVHESLPANDLNDMLSYRNICDETWEQVCSEMTPEKLAGLSALFYFARELDFSEEYTYIYEDELRAIQVAQSSTGDSIKSSYLHIYEKTNAVTNIIKSLYFLKKFDIAEELVSIHKLDEKFSWLDEARNGSLFKKPHYCGYAV